MNFEAVILLCGIFAAYWTDANSVSPPKKARAEVTVQDLIEHPGNYNGKEVTATGIASIEFENTALRPPAVSRNTTNSAVWLELPELKPELKKFDLQLVRVCGIFHAGRLGHFGMFQGAITNIKEIKKIAK